jgi:transcriptional regulator with XRE-family HTH domain
MVTQEQFAHTIGYTVRWYRKLELGEQANYSDEFLDSVATGFQLNDAEKILLFLLAAGREPPAPPSSGEIDATDTAQLIIDAQPWPAFTYTEAYDIVAVNKHMRTWFAWAQPGANVMEWIFTSPEAHKYLHRWKEDWAPFMLSKLRFSLARCPEHERLTELITGIIQTSAEARALWEAPNSPSSLDGPRRSLTLPYHGKIQPVKIVAYEELSQPHGRMAIIIPPS